ncbi:MAG: hypothetical protein HQL93_07205 [Magnetococcales bacterium]|nr:hypothetical protein [Magnetococcales bacterium]
MSQLASECNPELVSAFLDNELERIIIGRVAKHLLHCDHCCHTMSRLASVRDAVSEQFALCEPELLTQSVMMAIRNEKSTSPRDRMRDKLLRFGIPLMLVGTILAEAMPTTLEAGDYVEFTEDHRSVVA